MEHVENIENFQINWQMRNQLLKFAFMGKIRSWKLMIRRRTRLRFHMNFFRLLANRALLFLNKHQNLKKNTSLWGAKRFTKWPILAEWTLIFWQAGNCIHWEKLHFISYLWIKFENLQCVHWNVSMEMWRIKIRHISMRKHAAGCLIFYFGWLSLWSFVQASFNFILSGLTIIFS